MKTQHKYFLLLFAFASFTLVIFHFRKKEPAYEIKIRQGELSATTEWANTKAAIESLILKVNSNPDDERSAIALGLAYIQEGRISGDHAYYDEAALRLFEKLLNDDETNYEALIGKATVLLSQHHFTDALPVAEKAVKVNSYSAVGYGLLTDAYVELGKYDQAIQMADKMVNTRPDLRSYSRVSYLREIFGDYSGSIEAMKLAVSSGYPGMEQTEWCRYQLGHLYENTGDLTKAKECFDQCIFYRPSFAMAYAGNGRVSKALGNYPEAIKQVSQAMAIMNDFSFQQELTELYRLTNQQDLAYQSAQKAIELLGGMEGDEGNKFHGHYADKELAYAYLDSYQYMKAYSHALIEYNRRPGNIEVNQTLAWVNYKLGKYDEANKYINVALCTHSKNPVLIYQAALIKSKSGMAGESKKLFEQSIALNPYLSPLLQWERKQLFASK